MRPLALLTAAAALAGCGPRSDPASTAREATAYVEPAASPVPAPPSDERAETAEVVSIRAGTYPLYNLTLRLFTAERETTTLLADAEGLGLGGDGIARLEGLTVAVRYTQRPEPELRDLQLNGKSLLGPDAPAPMPGLMRVEGLLSGAQSLSGDLPAKLVITPASGAPVSFDWYVTEAERAANGRTVTGFYSLRPANRILSISPAS